MGVTPECLGLLQGVKWKLAELWATFKGSFSIHYFSVAVRSEVQQRQLNIYAS